LKAAWDAPATNRAGACTRQIICCPTSAGFSSMPAPGKLVRRRNTLWLAVNSRATCGRRHFLPYIARGGDSVPPKSSPAILPKARTLDRIGHPPDACYSGDRPDEPQEFCRTQTPSSPGWGRSRPLPFEGRENLCLSFSQQIEGVLFAGSFGIES